MSAPPSACQTWYELSTAGTIGGRIFRGSEPRGANDHLSFFDTPLFETLDFLEKLGNASDALDVVKPDGRIMGAYWPSGEGNSFLASGFWNFHFFGNTGDEDNHDEGWMSANLGFGFDNTTSDSPHVVTGGTGKYLGVIGRIETTVISADPFVIKYDFCPEEASTFDRSTCKDVFEWSSFGVGEISGESFSGSVLAAPHTGLANTPIFGDADVERSPLIGRLVAQYFLDVMTTASGSFNFLFYPEREPTVDDIAMATISDAVSINFGFGPLDTSLDGSFTRGTPNIVLGGTGQYAGLIGSMRDRTVNSDPLVFNYQICPADDVKPKEAMQAPCRKIYEWSTGGEFQGYRFSGSVEYENGALGVFDTPFFDEPPDTDGNAHVAGRVMGYYVPNGGSVAGNWNFAFFDHKYDSVGAVPTEHESWIAASLGFYQYEDKANEIHVTKDGVPNVIMGGSGLFSGFSGTITSNVISSDPFLIEWEICQPDATGGEAIPTDEASSSDVTKKQGSIFLVSLVAAGYMFGIWL